ncbi:MAG TPA: thioesterase domain-containing protein [Gammaproteobacteria bacterium]|jgi:hypothetical protein|nr:thioesterase domain-containing protein [Gammaproteobacteria bacterium]
MPFIKFDNTSFEQSHTSDPDNLPIFLIPGILGNSNELYKLAEEINAQKKGRTPIYIYQEPPATDELMNMSLAVHANKIAQEILEIRRFSPLPYILVGYSFGGILASEVAKELQASKYDPRVYVIDEPALSCVKKYMDPENKSNFNFYQDLAKIVNYAAFLSDITPHSLTDEFLNEHISDEFEEFIYHFAVEITENQATAQIDDANITNFITYLEIAKRNLRNMAYSDSPKKNILDNVHVIFTNETARKYSSGSQSQTAKDFLGEWDQCSVRVSHLNPNITSKLSTQSHLDLLKGVNFEKLKKYEDELKQCNEEQEKQRIEELKQTIEKLKQKNNAALVSGLITNSLKHEISPNSLISKQFLELVSQVYSASNKKPLSPMQFFNLFNSNKVPQNSIDEDLARRSSLTIPLDQSSDKLTPDVEPAALRVGTTR